MVYVFVMDRQSFMEDHSKGYVKKYFGENLSAQEAWWRVGGALLLLCTCVVIFFLCFLEDFEMYITTYSELFSMQSYL